MRYRLLTIGLMAVVFLFGLAGRPVAAQESAKKTVAKKSYLSVDHKNLGQTLRRLGLGTLLEALAAETGDLELQLVVLKSKANSPSLKPKERQAITARIATRLSEQIKKLEGVLEKTTNEDAREEILIKLFNARVDFVDTQGRQRGKSHFDLIIFLLGSEEDRKTLEQITAVATKLFNRTSRDLQEALADAKHEPRKMVYLVPELEDIEKRLEYRGAYLLFYRAIVLPKKSRDERTKLLKKAAKLLKPFEERVDYGVQPYAKLLLGRVYREQGKYKDAETLFTWAAGKNSIRGIQVEALFEKARNRIQWGAWLIRRKKIQSGNKKFAAAETAVAEFAKQGQAILGKAGELGIDLKKLVLNDYLYSQWASALRKMKKNSLAVEKDVLGQKAFLEIIEKYKGQPGVVIGFAELFEKKTRGKKKDLAKMPPGLLSLLAQLELSRGKDLLARAKGKPLAPAAQKMVDKHLKQAMGMFGVILKQDSAAAKAVKPAALFGQGECYYWQKEYSEAAKLFRQVVESYEKSEYAPTAALYAVKIIEALIRQYIEKNKPVPRQLREEMVKSIITMLKLKGDKPEATTYNFDLGWQYMKLAESAASDDAKRKELLAAIDAFKRVPAKDMLSTAANFYMLDLRYKLLQMAKNAKADLGAARKLKSEMINFATAIHAKWKAAPSTTKTNAPTKQDLGLWGSTSAFHAWQISYDFLGLKDEALRAIAELKDRWQGTAVLRESQTFSIRKLLEQGKVDKGVQEFKAFQKEYGDKEAKGLMELVVDNLRSAIDKLAATDKDPGQLKKFREAFKGFGRQFYEALPSDAPAEDKYYVFSLYADALIQAGNTEDAKVAMPLLLELKKIDQSQQEAQKTGVTGYFKDKIAAALAAGENLKAALAIRKDLEAALKHFKLNWSSNIRMAEVKYRYDQMQTAEQVAKKASQEEKPAKEKDKARAIKRATLSIRKAYDALQKQLLGDTAIDANVVRMLAKCYLILKEYDKAAPMYEILTTGLTPEANHDLYWGSELEYAQCLFGQNKTNPEGLKTLRTRLRQLAGNDPNRGGQRYLRRFNRIEADCNKIIDQNGQK
ncbi:MAG: hypothetical protein K8S55_08355 [Phycisphaerae bacterium]|nr:hypothetical protein [Phycisphaerae bacterium]